MFICVRGASFDGHTFAKEAAEKGAAVLLVEEPVEVPETVTVIQVEDTRYAMALVSAAWFGTSGQRADHHRCDWNQGQNHHYLYDSGTSGGKPDTRPASSEPLRW